MRDIYRAGLRVLGLCALASVISCGGDGGGGSGFLPIVSPSGNAPPDSPPTTPNAGALKIQTLSNRADMISDGDAYIEIVMPQGASATDLAVDLNGKDVSSSFALRGNGRVLGTVTGLGVGSNTLTATLRSQKKGASLAIENFNRAGNIFAGVPIQPWICATKAPKATLVTVAGTGLSDTVTTQVSGLDSDPVDADCNAPTVYTYYYQPKAKEGTDCGQQPFGPYACYVQYDPAKRPADADIANFTNDRGDTVKSLLRVELGTMGRSEYRVAVYFDPAQPWTPWAPQKGWNGKVLWKMGASASGNRFQQNPGTALFDDNALRAGFMTVNSQLTNHNDNNNEFLATENIMMVKEHIIDTYGEIRYTMSDGSSGGSMMQTVPASVMPGLLDGLQTGYSYPDAVTTWIEGRDCGILWRYLHDRSGHRTVACGKGSHRGPSDGRLLHQLGLFVPRAAEPGAGRELRAGLSGLHRLRPGRAAQGRALHDPRRDDGDPRHRRSWWQHRAQSALRQRGRAVRAEGLAVRTPHAGGIRRAQRRHRKLGRRHDLVGRQGRHARGPGPRAAECHDRAVPQRPGQLREEPREGADHRPAVRAGRRHPHGLAHLPAARAARRRQRRARQPHRAGERGRYRHRDDQTQAFLMMDRWLAAIEADTSQDAKEKKVVKNKPADAVDFCIATAGMTNAELVDVGFTSAACPVKPYESVRIVSGGPLSEDVFKCQLKPIDFASADYAGATFTGGQQVRLQAAFPDGVCDWSKPGVGQVPWTPTTFRSGPGGQDIPAVPVSVAF